MERSITRQTSPGEVRQWPEGKCPLESLNVVCGNCGTGHFSIDYNAPRSKNRVPGRCDECGYTVGKNIT